MDTQEEGEDSTKEKEEEEEDPPSTEKIPESYSRRLAEIYLEMADVHQRKSQFDNLKLLTQVERRLNDLVALYYCLVKHQIF